jgi:hypothetical protein
MLVFPARLTTPQINDTLIVIMKEHRNVQILSIFAVLGTVFALSLSLSLSV